VPCDPHERARMLIDQTLVEGISQAERHWVLSHMEICEACGTYAELSANIIRELKSLHVDTDPDMNGRVQQAVMTHARRLAIEQSRIRNFFTFDAQHLRWALVTAALCILTAVAPIYRRMQNKQREATLDRADALLLERVDARVSRDVPVVMEPLVLDPSSSSWSQGNSEK
jgi:hypothetical protein